MLGRRWQHWLETRCHSLEQVRMLGLRSRTEERECVSQGIEGAYFGDIRATVPPPSCALECPSQSVLLMEMRWLCFLPNLHLLASLLVRTVSYILWHHIIKLDDYADANESLQKPSTWTKHHEQVLTDYAATEKILFKIKYTFTFFSSFLMLTTEHFPLQVKSEIDEREERQHRVT